MKSFITNVANDIRIPKQDKKIILILIALILSPVDFIPDWVPIFGLMDDYIMLALIFDYLFNVIDPAILLSHYPWSMKSFNRLQRVGYFMAFFAPGFIRNNLWKYKRDPF